MTPEELHTVWQQDPSTDNLNNVLKSVNKVVDFAVGGVPNSGAHTKHQARLYAAEAIQSYDPAAGVKLSTHVQHGMQKLKRYQRTSGGPVKVADRTALDAYAIEKAKTEFMDQHGREPDMKELADKTMMPITRIGKVRRLARPVVASGALGEVAQHEPDYLGEALEYVYDGADHIDRRLIEMSTGLGGTDVMADNIAIAQALNISPSQVTRRNARIRLQVQEMEKDLEDVS